jgi:hypothetical protein
MDLSARQEHEADSLAKESDLDDGQPHKRWLSFFRLARSVYLRCVMSRPIFDARTILPVTSLTEEIEGLRCPLAR